MLDRTTYFIREHTGLLKLSDTYDILDPETQEQLGIAQEKPGTAIQVLRFFVNKQMLPTQIMVYEGSNSEDASKLLFSIKRGFTFLRSKIDICDAQGQVLGSLQSKLFSLGGAFSVFDAAGTMVANVKGDWKGWTFRFLDQSENELGTISKKWAGLGKELFTSADNYILHLNSEPSKAMAILLLAGALAVDTVYKEGRG
jgi:uncharacterized protein YxjI